MDDVANRRVFLINPEDLLWRPSNTMKIPNADFLERTRNENLGASLWRLPPMSANTLHRHPRMEEFYFVLEGTGRMRIDDQNHNGAQAWRGARRPKAPKAGIQ